MKTKFNRFTEMDNTNNPFKLPDNYFARFNDEIMNRLPEKEMVVPASVSLWDKVKPWVYLAAMFVGFYITIQFLTKDHKNLNLSDSQVATQQALTESSGYSDNYWSTARITEEEFYLYLEDQLIEDVFFEYMYQQYYLN